ncbi:hypothetical protein VHUM_03216 [Vanrija humicola]|uniref:Small nuclear ribonucleoprotein Prp3 C-terminal domain-containing protein n=1 Tax=Vanrija humicola TaxID=5417 RepID=A0A7D8UYA2_VANHU|nr:hypothetical protein VHUM_03216 [Vanrija humicola]
MADDALQALAFFEAMYPLDGELQLSDAARAALDGYNASGEADLGAGVDSDDAASDQRVELAIALPVTPGPTRISLRQPDFLTRAAYEQLAAAIPPPSDDPPSDAIMLAVEAVRTAALELPSAPPSPKAKDDDDGADDGPLERVWFWFPSLSTREKRKDLVTYAATYRLKGFVLSGKPALLCLEGGGRAVDRYMAAIKSESWGDIPSYQKKVTERLRRPITDAERKFSTMTDITHLITHHGTYNHRGDMSEVKKYMDEWGVGDDFAGAVMNAS